LYSTKTPLKKLSAKPSFGVSDIEIRTQQNMNLRTQNFNEPDTKKKRTSGPKDI